MFRRKIKNIWMICFALGMLQGCTHMLFYPMPQHVITPDALNIRYEDIHVSAVDGTRLHGWWLHARDAVRARVLFFHGNAENISTHIAHVYWLTDYGYEVIAVDYRGYGHSEGEPGIEGSMQDIQAVLKYVLDHAEPALPLVVVGQSLGGSLSVPALAQTENRNELAAVILISSFSDFRAITQDALAGFWLTWPLQWPLSFTVDNRFSPEEFIARLAPVPVLIMHGDQDRVVPRAHAKALFDAARQPKYFQLLRGDHNHIFNTEENRRLLLEYLNKFTAMEKKTG